MTTGIHSLYMALLFLALGVLELAAVQSMLYPLLRWRHERAKLTQSHGVDPSRIMRVIRIQSLLLMPLLGFVLGGGLKAMSS